MRAEKAIALLLVLMPGLILAQGKKKKPDVPALFQSAHFVYVESADGDAMKPGLYPPDRQAISDVQDGVREWSRYVLATERKQADLILVVRKGRLEDVQARGGISIPRPQMPGSGPGGRSPGQSPDSGSMGTQADVGPPEDMLRVYTLNGDSKLAGPLWTRSLKDGLDGPGVPLFQQLKSAVERAYPSQPATKQTTP